MPPIPPPDSYLPGLVVVAAAAADAPALGAQPSSAPRPTSAPRFGRLLAAAVLFPLAVMLVLGGLLAWQVSRLLSAASWVDRSDRAIALTNVLEKTMIDIETGERGFLVTGYPIFLEPYYKALLTIESQTDELEAMVASDPEQVRMIDDLRYRRERWLDFVKGQIARRANGGDYVSVAQGMDGKHQMDALRAVIGRLRDHEELLRKGRTDAAQAAAKHALWATAFIALFGGGLLGFLGRRQFARIITTYDLALNTAYDLNATLERRVAERTAEAERRSALLAEANRELEAFAYSVSHDLRAPMRHILGFADLLQRSIGSKLNAEDEENLGIISNTARVAGKMVDDLLGLSRLGRAALRVAPVDMAALAATARRDLDPDIKTRAIEFDIADVLPANGDEAMLKLVWQNLLSNAVKYTAQRPNARIVVRSQPEGDGIAYSVADNGVGFDMNYVDKLFGVFQRLHRAEEFEGTGIGLANVRRIIVRHGGKVAAQGVLGQGATFTFWLPRQVPIGD